MEEQRTKITRSEFMKYEGVRKSGITNMFNVKFVEKLSGLSREKIFTIMNNYGDLKKKYLDDWKDEQ